jgi:hypothetical protein
MSENLDNEQINRVWEYRLHIENLFYNRLNFFLVFESVLLGVVGALYSKPNPANPVLKVIVLLGFSITVIWIFVQARHKRILDVLSIRTNELMPEFRASWKRIDERMGWLRSLVPALFLLTYVVPSLVALVWIFLLFFL